ncbi:MAG: hypothetical protein ACWGSQ_14370 [Longimicrobiales bacterium]
MGIRMGWSDSDRRLTLRLSEDSRRPEGLPRTFVVRVASESASREVRFDGDPIGIHV